MTFQEFINSKVYFASDSTLQAYLERCDRRGWYPEEILNTWIRYDENKKLLVPWLDDNCEKRWGYRHACFWEFEDANDAMLFRLTWGDRIDNNIVR